VNVAGLSLVRRLAPVAVALVVGPVTLLGSTVVGRAASGTFNCSQLQGALTAAGNGNVITLQDTILCPGSFTLPDGIQLTLQGGTGTQGFDNTGGSGTPSLKGLDNHGTVIKGLTFKNSSNVAGFGGALSLDGDTTPQLQNLVLQNNTAGSAGGAAAISSNATTGTVTVSGCTFGSATNPSLGNHGGSSGGGLIIDAATSVSISNTVFARNTVASNSGGGAIVRMDTGGAAATLTLSGNQFLANTAPDSGGGAEIETRDPVQSVISNNLFRNNTLTTAGNGGRGHVGGGLDFGYPPAPQLNMPTVATQSNNVFDANTIEAINAAPQGAVARANPRTPASTFDYGGGGEWVADVQVTSTDDRFTNNTVAASNASTNGVPSGGGLGVDSTIRNTTFKGRNLVSAGNTVGAGGDGSGVYAGVTAVAFATDIQLFDSTVAGNTVGAGGAFAGISGDTGDTLELTNTIAAVNTGGAAQVGGFTTMTATYSDVCLAGTATMSGTGNSCADPRLVNPNPGTADVHETALSPTRNKGSNSLVPAGVTADYEADPRVAEAVVDVGADEFVPPAAQQLPVGLPKAGLGGAGETRLTGALAVGLLVAVLAVIATTRGRRRTD
jgi:hypothetical protein